MCLYLEADKGLFLPELSSVRVSSVTLLPVPEAASPLEGLSALSPEAGLEELVPLESSLFVEVFLSVAFTEESCPGVLEPDGSDVLGFCALFVLPSAAGVEVFPDESGFSAETELPVPEPFAVSSFEVV